MSRPRHVRQLRLRAGSQELARRASIQIEDAFHTATLPGADDSRLWLVRRLALGRIDSRAVGQTVALQLEQKFSELSFAGVHAEDASAASANIVFFHDAVEPHRCLAKRLLQRRAAAEWFWPLVFPEGRVDSPPACVWREIIFHLLHQRAGPLALAELFNETSSARVSEIVLTALVIEDGVALLKVCGWRLPERISPVAKRGPLHNETLTSHWKTILSTCVACWGTADARILWLAALGLVAETPLLLADSQLIHRAARVVGRSDFEIRKRQNKSSELHDVKRAAASNSSPMAAATGAIEQGTIQRLEPPPLFHSDSANLPTASRFSPQSTPAPFRKDFPPEIYPENPPQASDLRERSMQFSVGAGLIFLLPVLERLGLCDFLESNPELFSVNFPARLLLHVAAHFHVDSQDPICRALVPADTLEAWPQEFISPSAWASDLARRGPFQLRRLASLQKIRIACDSSGTLILGLWRGKAPPEIARLTSAFLFRRGPPFFETDPATILLNAWLTAARRWTRRFAGIGLGALVRRRGRVAATRTHLDLFFNLREADLRIRRTGLDLDHGWVPWLGKVIRFHYE